MKIKATWEFDVDTDELDPEFVDIYELAKDLTKQELNYLINNGLIDADDFEYSTITE